MSSDEHAHPAVYKDRKAGLIFFGILHVLTGFLILIFLAFMLAGLAIVAASSAPTEDVTMLAKALSIATVACVVAVVWCFWLGIGSILARRWARALILLVSCFWLIAGGAGLVNILLLFSQVFPSSDTASPAAKDIASFIRWLSFSILFVLYAVFPACLVLFYGSRHVKATCEAYDPIERWTDRCPLPLLGIALAALGWGCGLLIIGLFNWVMPFFGTLISGAAGAALALALLPALAYIVWGSYTRRISAWWCALVLALVWCVSCLITFSRVPMLTFYEQMHMPAATIEVMRQNPDMQWGVVYGMVWWSIVATAYLLYARRFFMVSSPASSSSFTQR